MNQRKNLRTQLPSEICPLKAHNCYIPIAIIYKTGLYSTRRYKNTHFQTSMISFHEYPCEKSHVRSYVRSHVRCHMRTDMSSLVQSGTKTSHEISREISHEISHKISHEISHKNQINKK